MIRGAIFDMDGVLLDSNRHWEKAAEKYLEGLGIEARPGMAQAIFEMTLPQAADYLIREYGVTQRPEEILEGCNAVMIEFYRKEIEKKEGIFELLDALQMKGIPMMVATVTDRPLVEAGLLRHGLLDFFEGIVTAAEAGEGKSSPRIYLEAAARMRRKPEEILLFEDALHAVKTAEKAGFITVGVYDSYSEAKQEELKKTARIYLRDYGDLSPLWREATI
ncbi:MAG: HAD family phosphatase [Lachnospiraceae bacterium]|nr:HAD family phosphatase [Lachnospiraceae bacterium]